MKKIKLSFWIGLGLFIHAPLSALAHGYVTEPMARQAICAQQGGFWNPADGSAIPNTACRKAYQASGSYPFTQAHEFSARVASYRNDAEVRKVVRDNQLCAAADPKKAGLDVVDSNWQRTLVKTDSSGNFKLRFLATATHNPNYWEIYLSKAGFDIAKEPLKWSLLEKIASFGNLLPVTGTDGQKYYEMTIKIPASRTGNATLYTRWQRDDPAGEGFYNCSDITIKRS